MPSLDDPLAIGLPEKLVDEIARRAASLVLQELQPHEHDASPYVTIPEAAELLRAKRHRVDDLLSRGTLTRIKDGSRTLILRAEIDDYLAGRPTGRSAR
jgi:excisionase family DNA binding protein